MLRGMTTMSYWATSELVVASTAEWRAWLSRNCRSAEPQREVWLVIQRKGSEGAGVPYDEAIEQALCFGWIDSHARKRDAGSFRLRFTPRSERSTWSAVNRERAARMIEQGLMTRHGQAQIDRAQATGTWQVTGRPAPGPPTAT